MSRYILLILVIVVVIGGSYFFLRNSGYLSTTDSSVTTESTESSPQPADIEGLVERDWIWTGTSFQDGNTVVPAQPDAFVVRFIADGSLSAQTDCNTFLGSFETIEPDSISIIANASTMMACVEPFQQDEFMEALGRAASFVINEDGLTLGLSDSSQMNFR